MKPRVLLAWELGQNLGHLARLLTVAQTLDAAGAELIWAVPQHALHSVWLASAPGLKTLAPPLWDQQAPKDSLRSVHSYADILALVGFAQPDVIKSRVAAWREVFTQHRIQKVVLDYAPNAQWAAYQAGLPAAQITNGFDSPPADCPVFGVSMRGPMLEKRNAAQLEAVNQGLAASLNSDVNWFTNSSTPLQTLLNYPTRWYDCLNLTDPYGPRTDGTYVGPLGQLSHCVQVPWPDGPPTSQKVLVYLRQEPLMRDVLQALSLAKARVIAFWPDATPQALLKLSQGSCTISTQAIDLHKALPECDAVVNYGSAGLVSQTLMAGKPQLMMPSDVEKHLIASRVAACGAGLMLNARASSVQIRQAVEQILLAPSIEPSSDLIHKALQLVVEDFLEQR
jgi:UDP:flavonoid glycosyltransferase YjiC (YdhE family)